MSWVIAQLGSGNATIGSESIKPDLLPVGEGDNEGAEQEAEPSGSSLSVPAIFMCLSRVLNKSSKLNIGALIDLLE